MKKKIILVSIIFVLFLVEITSSGLLSYFGQITGQITILPSEEPEKDVPETMDDCKDNGWENLITLSNRLFENQGDCISYVQTSMCEDFGLLDGYPDNFNSSGGCVSYFASKGNSSGKEEGTSGGSGGSGNENMGVNIGEVNITFPTTPENVSPPEEINVTLPENVTETGGIEEDNTTETFLEQPVTEPPIAEQPTEETGSEEQPITEPEDIEQTPETISEEEIVETEEEQTSTITETENTEQPTEQPITPTEEIIQEETKNTEIVPEATSEPQTEESSETNS